MPEAIPIPTTDYLKLSFLFEGNITDDVINSNRDQYKKLTDDLLSVDKFESLIPHKYDYKCFPIGLMKNNRIN